MSADEREQLASAIAVLEAQRGVLGDAVIDMALGPMRHRLAALAVAIPGAPPEQARRQVSVLFLDVVGAAVLSAVLDPEDLHAVLEGVFERCTQRVREHGGRVLQYAGDNLLAAFGSEGAREDDAERAVHCGLALLAEGDALRERVLFDHGRDGCDVRVGIHTGPVLLGGGVDEEGTIRGVTVNIAARMEQHAPEGALRISHDTWLLVRTAFNTDAQPLLRIKGSDEPLQTYLVTGARGAAQRAAWSSLEAWQAPLIGRDAPRARVLGLAGEANRTSRLQALTIVGEPGVGKSRLLRELTAPSSAAVTGGAGPRLLLARANPGMRLQPYGLLRNVLTTWLRIADGDTLEQARARLADGLQPWLGDDAPTAALRIGRLIGLALPDDADIETLEPSALRQHAFAALNRLLHKLSASGGNTGALLLLFEDLHWSDDGSLDFIAALRADASAPPIALLATARPEFLERRPDWTLDVLMLDTLGPGDANALAAALLSRIDGGAAALKDRLVELAGGNPFFMEELVRMCLDQGVIVRNADDGDAEGAGWRVLPDRLAGTHMPTTLVGVLQARLDSLPPAQRKALQKASIVGHVFWDDALAALDEAAPAQLPALQGRHLVQRRDRSSFDDTPEEVFRHHVLQQVTYDTVLKSAREAGHAAIALWLSARSLERSSEFLSITAQHYERAGDLRQACDFYQRAALDAARRFANAAALEHVQHALHCVDPHDQRRASALQRLRQQVADLMGLRSVQADALQCREEIAAALADDAMLADVTMGRALLASRHGQESQAYALAERAQALAVRSGSVEVAAMARAQLAWSSYSQGRLDESLSLAEQAVADARAAWAHADTLELRTLLIKTLNVLGICQTARGRLSEASATLVEGLERARADGLRQLQLSLVAAQASLEAGSGRPLDALPLLRANLTLSEELGSKSYLASTHQVMAECLRDVADDAAAIRHIRISLQMSIDIEDAGKAARCHLILGQLLAGQGDVAAAFESYRLSAMAAESIDLPAVVIQAHAASAALALARGDIDAATTWAEQADALLATGVSLFSTDATGFAPLVLYRVWTQAGDPRADAMLDRAWRDLQTLTERLEGDRRRTIFDMPVNRELIAALQARGRDQLPT